MTSRRDEKPGTKNGKHGPMVKRKRLPWVYCRKCGLLRIRNEATDRAFRAPCPGYDEDDDD